MQFEAVKKLIYDRLENELPDDLTYHNLQHTRDVVMHSEELAAGEGVQGRDLMVLLTAAVLHDSGFLETYAGHEGASCRIARDILPGYGYSPADIDQVCKLIMSTTLPREPFDKLSRILCDADLYYLGTDLYETISGKLFREMENRNLIAQRDEWHRLQLEFLKTHGYFTETANRKLGRRLQHNLKKLETSRKPHPWYADITVREIMLAVSGVVVAGFALKGFLIPNHFFDGGVTGISLLLHEIYGWNIAYVIVLANIPFILMGLYTINRAYAIKTFTAIVMLGLCLLYIPYPTITSDKLLISVFGGFFLGSGIGLMMRTGSAIDGIEVLAVYTLKRTSFTISEIILGLNIIIFSIAAFKFGLPTAFYSMLTYFVASKSIDYVVEGIEAYTGVTIISGKSEIIKDRLVNEMGRALTVYKGERGFLPGRFEIHENCDIIFTVITRLEMRKLKNLIYEIDPKAFVFANTIREASGGVMKRRHSHH